MRLIVYLILVLCLISIGLTIVRAITSTIFIGTRRNSMRRREPEQPLERLVRDPVCGTYVAERTAIRSGDQAFCSEECRKQWKG